MPLDMISERVNVEASFNDPRSLSRPQVCPDLPDVSPLPLGLRSTPTFPPHSCLLSGTFYEVFATFIVGPPDHSNAGTALHSHPAPPRTQSLTT